MDGKLCHDLLGVVSVMDGVNKKMKGGILEQIKEVRLMLAAEEKMMLGDEENSVHAGTLEGRVA